MNLVNIRRVLTVSQRPAELCAAKAMLNGAGFDVVTATNLPAAQVVLRAMRCDAAFVCRHSFTAAEREEIAVALIGARPELVIVGRCPGCVGCDEQACIIGRLEDTDAVSALIAALSSPRPPAK